MFRRLLSFDEAERVISRHVPAEPLSVERVAILDAFGRVLAEDVVAGLGVPSFDRSTVDGFAVRARDTFGADENRSVKLRVGGNAVVGKLSRCVVKPCVAVGIVTGAPLPVGADAVVMVEDTELRRGVLLVRSAVVEGSNVMRAGSDFKKGEVVLRRGAVLGSAEVGVLAAVGLADVDMFGVPRVAVLSTGAEVTRPGGKLLPGRVFDTNAYSLCAAVAESGGVPVFLGVFPDRAAVIRRALVKALACADVVVTSGGVSVGSKDFLPGVLGSFGEPGVVVSGVAIKPGKPFTVAVVGGKLVFALPGHPASALLVFLLFVRPVVEALGGRKPRGFVEVEAVAGARMFSAKGRRTFVSVKLVRDERGGLVAEPVPVGLSGAISTLAGADGFVEVAENRIFVDAGDEVAVKLLRECKV
jgi:putative molybdopterin biosynthesis protein